MPHIDNKNKKIGVGMIARDAKGIILASMCTLVPFIIDPTVAEAMAAWKAAVFCRESGFSRVYLESDALEIVQALHWEATSWVVMVN
jgi:hypothetical protein